MRMTRVLYGLAALPLLAGVALAETPQQTNGGKALAKEPMRLTAQQMDKVTAGWDLYELDIFNTGFTVVSIYERLNINLGVPGQSSTTSGNTIVCPGCFLLINNPAFSVASKFGR